MSKVVKAIGGLFGGAPKVRSSADAAQAAAMNASTIGGPLTPEQLAEQRAALAASGGRRKGGGLALNEAEGTRPLQGGSATSSYWS